MSCTSSNATNKPNFVTKDAPNADSVAKIGDQVITLDELIGDQKLQYLEIKKREHEFKMERLNELVKDKLLSKEAANAKMEKDAFIMQKVVKGNVKASEAEFNKFVAEKKIPEKQISPEIKERINKYLEDQKKDEKINEYLAKLTKGQPVEVYFKKPKLTMDIEVGTGPIWGSKSAPVTIVEFSDFQCPFCSKAAATVDEVKKKYKGKIQLAFRHFPLSFHKEAGPAAEASMCLNEQSVDKFWKYHDILFENQKELDQASLDKYAKQAGANMDKYKECMTSGRHKETVKKDTEYGEKIGVRSTPTFFINGELVSGALPLEAFSEVIEEAIAETKKN